LNISDESSPLKKPGMPDGNSSDGVNTRYACAASTIDHYEDQICYLFSFIFLLGVIHTKNNPVSKEEMWGD